MLTLLLYVLIVGLVAALLFLVASAIFGRSEELGPLPEGTTVTVLPAAGISGSDVRALRFQQVLRGYKAGEVDWALTRLAARIDELEHQLAAARGDRSAVALSKQPSPNGAPGTAAAAPVAQEPVDAPAPRRIPASESPAPGVGDPQPVPQVLPGVPSAGPAEAAVPAGDPWFGQGGPATTSESAETKGEDSREPGAGAPGAR